MFEKLKQKLTMYKRVVGVVVSLFVILFLAIMALKVAKDIQILDSHDQTEVKNTISVNGKGEEMVVPDIATISLGIEEKAKTVVEANNLAATKMNKAKKVLKDAGIDEKDIKTTNYSVYPSYDYVKTVPMPLSPVSSVSPDIYYPNGKQVLSGYVVNESMEVKIRKLDKAGDILAKVSEIGLNNVSGLTFSVDKEDVVKNKARETAINNAKEQAKILAKQLGVRLGKLISFSDAGNYTFNRYDSMKSYAPAMASGSGVAPEISAGENKITSNVTLVYEIK